MKYYVKKLWQCPVCERLFSSWPPEDNTLETVICPHCGYLVFKERWEESDDTA